MPSFSLTHSPGKAAATGEDSIPCAMTQCETGTVSPPGWLLAWQQSHWDRCTCLTADVNTGRVPGDAYTMRDDCKESRLHLTIHTEVFLHIKNNQSQGAWGIWGAYNSTSISILCMTNPSHRVMKGPCHDSKKCWSLVLKPGEESRSPETWFISPCCHHCIKVPVPLTLQHRSPFTGGV